MYPRIEARSVRDLDVAEFDDIVIRAGLSGGAWASRFSEWLRTRCCRWRSVSQDDYLSISVPIWRVEIMLDDKR
jgi:hypothetical protein